MPAQRRPAVLICTFSFLSAFFYNIHYLDVHVCIYSVLFSALGHRVGALQISCIIILIIIIITTTIIIIIIIIITCMYSGNRQGMEQQGRHDEGVKSFRYTEMSEPKH